MRFPKLGVRTRILAIALVPSLVLVIIGLGATGTLVDRAEQARSWADELDAGIAPTRELIEAVQLERRLTLWRVAGADSDIRALTSARQQLDTALRDLAPAQSRLAQLGPQSMAAATDALSDLGRQLAATRSGVDANTVALPDVYAFYNRIPQVVIAGVEIAQHSAPDAATAAELREADEVLHSLEAMSRADALAAALVDGDGLTPDLGGEYLSLVGYYRTHVEGMAAEPDTDRSAAAKTLVTSAAWQQLGQVEPVLSQHTLIDPTARRAIVQPLPIPLADWLAAANEVNRGLAQLWQTENTGAQRLASAAASDTARKSLWAGAGLVFVALGAIAVALVLANRIIGRLKRLRDRTLALADEQLPETMRRLAAGEHLEVDTEAPRLDFGRDEIGQVADAFGHAHAAAVSAAVTEARTREGVKSVFLNIAHRSQVVVHRQLELLDEAESRQENPEILDTLFRLDHLATRERRNAENLIILAGGRPGRQWRDPVPLVDLVRSAVGETADYTRVRTGRLPAAFITGVAVADLIHLLAELIDNAASFSPPASRVEVSATSVGRGVAVEISDQGVGIPEAELARLNTMLAAPPELGFTALSADSRLGLFVVSQLAGRHDISVRLSDSDYGGIRAIVLIPSTIIDGEIAAPDRRTRAPEFSPPVPQPVAPAPDFDAWADPPRSEPAGRHRMAPTPGEVEPIRAPEDWGFIGTGPAHTQVDPAEPEPDDRPELPRRRRQASLAPELANEPESTPHTPASERDASGAEQTRDLFSAIEHGTRQGRQADPGPLPPATPPQKGDGEHLPRW